jgi:hypothetical protein
VPSRRAPSCAKGCGESESALAKLGQGYTAELAVKSDCGARSTIVGAAAVARASVGGGWRR